MANECSERGSELSFCSVACERASKLSFSFCGVVGQRVNECSERGASFPFAGWHASEGASFSFSGVVWRCMIKVNCWLSMQVILLLWRGVVEFVDECSKRGSKISFCGVACARESELSFFLRWRGSVSINAESEGASFLLRCGVRARERASLFRFAMWRGVTFHN